MGIPFTNSIMPVVHIIPINPATKQYVRLSDVTGEASSDYFDFGSNFQFLNMHINSEDCSCQIEFVDPTFKNFENVLKLVNREVFSNYYFHFHCEVRLGWVGGRALTESEIIYPLGRTGELRVGGSGSNVDGRLLMMGGEIISEPIWVEILKTQYSVQATGIRYTLEGKFTWGDEENRYSQSDENMPADCSYLTLLYRVAAKMNIFIRFDNSATDKFQLLKQASKFAFENKKNEDNLARLIENINTMEKWPLHCSESSSPKDAELAMKQMSDIFKGNIKEDISADSQIDKYSQNLGKIYTGIAAQTVAATILPVAIPFPLVGEYSIAAANNNAKNELIASEDERRKLNESINLMISHYKKVSGYEARAWKTYVISWVPPVNNMDGTYQPNSTAGTNLKSPFAGVKFLGVYTHFGKDIESLVPSGRGIDTSMSVLTMSSINIDETVIRMTQIKEWQQIAEWSGMKVNYVLDLYKEAYKSPSTSLKAATNLINVLDEKSRIQSGVNSIQSKNTGTIDYGAALQESIRNGVTGPASNILLQIFKTNVINAEQMEIQSQQKALELLKSQDPTFAMDDAQRAQIDAAYNKALQNPYYKNSDVSQYIMYIDNQFKNRGYLQSSLNPEDNKVKTFKQVTVLAGVPLVLESMKRAANDVRYNREALKLTLNVVGDIAIGKHLQSRAFLFLKFFNPRRPEAEDDPTTGSLNQFLTGYYLLVGFKHHITSSSVFTTELELVGHDFKGNTPLAINGTTDLGLVLQNLEGGGPSGPTSPPPPPNGGAAGITGTAPVSITPNIVPGILYPGNIESKYYNYMQAINSASKIGDLSTIVVNGGVGSVLPNAITLTGAHL